jgi:hypothetical protein
MAEFPLTIVPLSGNACYPTTVQQVVDLVAEYATLNIQGVKQAYTISSTTPPDNKSNQLWLQTTGALSGYGDPKVIRWNVNGAWLEFATLSQGDRVLVQSVSTITSPWGEYGYTYSFASSGISSYTPTVSPIAPEGMKYKVYVGYWDSRTP